MAKLYRKKGRTGWWCTGRDVSGKRWWKPTRQTNRKAAEVAARQIELRIASGEADRSEVETLASALANVLHVAERGQRAKSTIDYRATKARHLVRILGDTIRLDQIDKKRLGWYADRRLAEGADPHTIHKELGTLRRAIRLSDIPWDPKLMPDLGRVYEPEERWLEPWEYPLLLNSLRARWQPYLAMWCYTGMRESELYAVRPNDVQLGRRLLHIRGTKTQKADRWMPLTDLIDGTTNPAFVILESRMNLTPMFPRWNHVWTDLRDACIRAGLRPVNCLDLRRTFCSGLANAGVSMRVCAELMGHTSTRMVEQVYARLGLGIQEDAVSKLPTPVTTVVTEIMETVDVTILGGRQNHAKTG